MQEKRRCIRVKTNAVISYKVKQSGLADDVRIIDISEGGVCFPSKQYIPINTRLEIEIRSEDIQGAIKLTARVVRIINRDHSKYPFEVSLEFSELSFAQWNMLHEHIQHCLPLTGADDNSGS